MGIDVYLKWDNQTDAEESAQITGFCITAGEAGYLREAYHGSPYATHALFPKPYWDCTEEEYEAGGKLADIAELRARLPYAVLVTLYRHHAIYEQGSNPGFIKLDDDKPVESGIGQILAGVFAGMSTAKADTDAIVKRITPEQAVQAAQLIEKRELPDYALSYVDFVRLAEKMAADGRNPRVYISY